MQVSQNILVLNSGSSSIKFAIFDDYLEPLLAGSISEIGGESFFNCEGHSLEVELNDHQDALNFLLQKLENMGFGPKYFSAAGHRVVHGGTQFSETHKIDEGVIQAIRDLSALAPLHNPANLAGIIALKSIVPDLPQYAVFDTAFHARISEARRYYALSENLSGQGKVKYGFHGISYAGLVENFSDETGEPFPGKLLACHLGNGASLCAIVNGHSHATTMGYSPVEGLVMGTRSGSIDANLVLDLVAEYGADQAREILNFQSGIKALAGTSDMREIEMNSNDPQCEKALAIYDARLCELAGAMIASMGGVDAIVFTGGVGENSAMRRLNLIDNLEFLGFSLDLEMNALNRIKISKESSKPVYIIQAREERSIASEVKKYSWN